MHAKLVSIKHHPHSHVKHNAFHDTEKPIYIISIKKKGGNTKFMWYTQNEQREK